MNTLSSPTPAEKAADLLVETVQQISGAKSMQEIIDPVKRAARLATGADGVSFVLREGDQCFYADEDAVSPLWKGLRFPMTACISGWAMLNRSGVAVPDIRLDSRIPQDAYRPTFVRSLVMMPIRRAAPIGALGVYWSKTYEATAAEIRWLQALADATSTAIDAMQASLEVRRLQAFAPASTPPPPPPMRGEVVRMCAWTRRIFHQGTWLTIESYLQTRFGVEVSHSISETAMDSLLQSLEGEGA